MLTFYDEFLKLFSNEQAFKTRIIDVRLYTPFSISYPKTRLSLNPCTILSRISLNIDLLFTVAIRLSRFVYFGIFFHFADGLIQNSA